jgi:hypothetical protein
LEPAEEVFHVKHSPTWNSAVAIDLVRCVGRVILAGPIGLPRQSSI